MSRRDRPATMEDVAARAGVSRAVVSIVYRNAPGASEATRARILQAGAELEYRPDHRARLLGRQRTRLLGVTFDVRASFHGDLVEALYAAAEAAGYDLALSAVAPSRDKMTGCEVATRLSLRGTYPARAAAAPFGSGGACRSPADRRSCAQGSS
jgi:DNA-binding LacI/PurR family transcriptional regulator